MFQQFAANYLLGRLYVEPHDIDVPAINRGHQKQLNERLYGEQEIYSTDNPFVMKVDETHLVVQGEDEVPEQTLAVPVEVIDNLRVKNPPEEKEVLLAKPNASLAFMFRGR